MVFRLPKDVNNLAAAARDLGQSGDEENNFAVPNLIVDANGHPIRSDNPLSVQVENQKAVQDVQLTGSNKSELFMEDLTITPGSVASVTLGFTGRKIGIGVRLYEDANFQIKILPLLKDTAIPVSRFETLVDQSEALSIRGVISFELVMARYLIEVRNEGNQDLKIRNLNVVEFH